MQKFDLTKLLPFYDKIEAACLAAFRAEAKPTPYGLLLELMDLPGLPMHCPPHHYIMPATLLTVAAPVRPASRRTFSGSSWLNVRTGR